MLYLTNVYGAKYGASALAANGLLRYLVGGSFPLFTIPSTSLPLPLLGNTLLIKLPVYNNLGYPWASSLLGFLAVVFAFLPGTFYVIGSRVRQFTAYFL